MEFIIKRTIDLNNQEIQSICDLFNNIFESHKKDIYLFQKEFLNSALGFSFHALMIDDDRIVGSHSLIPCNYKYGTKDILTAFSVDTMIEKKYRDFFNLKELVDLTEVEALKYGIKFIFGFPNDNSYPVLKKGLKYQDIGKLSTYI